MCKLILCILHSYSRGGSTNAT